MNYLHAIFLAGIICFGFVVETKAHALTRLDVVEKPNCEYLLALLDSFSLQVSGPSSTVGHLVFFPGSNPIQNAEYERYMRFYIARRKFDTKLFLYTVEPKNNPTVEFWIGPTGSRPSLNRQPLTRKLSIGAAPILFDSDLFEMFVEGRKRTFVGLACSACCLSSVDWILLAEFLGANPKLTAYIVIRGKRNRHALLQDYLRRDMKDSGLDAKKVKYLFTNRNLVNTSHFSEVDVFLSDKVIRSAAAFRSDFESKR